MVRVAPNEPAATAGESAAGAPAPTTSPGPAGSSTALLAIDRDLPGVSVERAFASLEGGRHVALRFDGVRVPASRVIGAIGEGMPRALRQIGDTRLAVAAFAVGSSMWAIDFVTRHLLAPHRRGAPLGDLESIRLRYGDLRIQVYAARSVLYRTARLAAAGGNVVNETMAAKVLATETLGGRRPVDPTRRRRRAGGRPSARAPLPGGEVAAAGRGRQRSAAPAGGAWGAGVGEGAAVTASRGSIAPKDPPQRGGSRRAARLQASQDYAAARQVFDAARHDFAAPRQDRCRTAAVTRLGG